MLHEQRVHSIDIKGYGSARRQCSLPRHHFPMRCLRSPPLCHPPASLPNPDKESQEVGHTALVAQAIPCRQATTSILQWSSPQRRGGCPQREGVAWPTSKETSHRPPQVCCHPPWPDDDEGLPLLLAISGCPQLLRRLPRRRRHLARCQDHRSPPLPAAPPASALAGRPRLLPLLPPARRASTATTANRPRRRRPPAVAALAAASEPCCCRRRRRHCLEVAPPDLAARGADPPPKGPDPPPARPDPARCRYPAARRRSGGLHRRCPGWLLWPPPPAGSKEPRRRRPCGCAALPVAAQAAARRRRKVGERGRPELIASRAAPGEGDARIYACFSRGLIRINLYILNL